MISTICKENWLGFKSSWLGFRISADDQGLGSRFRFSGSVFRVRVYPAVHLIQTRSCLPALKPLQHLYMDVGLSSYRCHGQLSRTCVPNLSCDYFSQSCSAKGICLMRQNRHYTKMYVVHHNRLSDSFQTDMDSMILTKTGFGSDVDIIFKKQDRVG